jgi:hypothetical protein
MLDAKERLVRRLEREGEPARWVSGRHVKDGRAQLDRDRKWVAVEVIGERPELSRGVINQRVGRVVRMFKWAVGEELVPVEVSQALKAVPGL